MKRREFIRNAIHGAAIVTTAAPSVRGVLGANQRVRVGLIGCGGRGLAVAKLMREVPGVEFVAVETSTRDALEQLTLHREELVHLNNTLVRSTGVDG